MAKYKASTEKVAVNLAEGYLCRICGGSLMYQKGEAENDHFLICAKDDTHEGFKQKPKREVEVLEGEKTHTLKLSNLTLRELAILPPEDLKHVGFGELTQLVQEVADPNNATAQAIISAVLYAQEVGAHPEIGEVVLYHGKPYLTDDFWIRRLREQFPTATLISRPLKDSERLEMMVGEFTHAWVAELYEPGKGLLANGFGFAMKDDKEPLVRGSAVEVVFPWRLAEKRAIVDCIKKIIPMSIKKEEGGAK